MFHYPTFLPLKDLDSAELIKQSDFLIIIEHKTISTKIITAKQIHEHHMGYTGLRRNSVKCSHTTEFDIGSAHISSDFIEQSAEPAAIIPPQTTTPAVFFPRIVKNSKIIPSKSR